VCVCGLSRSEAVAGGDRRGVDGNRRRDDDLEGLTVTDECSAGDSNEEDNGDDWEEDGG